MGKIPYKYSRELSKRILDSKLYDDITGEIEFNG